MTWYTSTGDVVNRVLGTKQRAKYDTLKANQGADAATAYKQQIAANKGYTQTAPTTTATTTTTPTYNTVDTNLTDTTTTGNYSDGTVNFTSYTDFIPTNTGYKTVNDYMPQTVEDVTTSVGYQWKQQQAQDALNQKLAAQGLGGSSYGVNQSVNIANELAADEYALLREDANTNLQNYYNNTNNLRAAASTEANRYDTLQQNELTNAQNAGDSQWSRLMDILNYSSSQNPMSYLSSGTTAYTNNATDYASTMADYIANNYSQYIPVSATRSGTAPTYIAPLPNQGKYGEGDIFDALLNLGLV